MTSNTKPSGVASANNEYAPAWNAFDGIVTTNWCSVVIPAWLQYEFPTEKCVKALEITNYSGAYNHYIENFKLQGSNDGIEWTDLGNFTNLNRTQGGVSDYLLLNNNDKYKIYRIYITSSYDGTNRVGKMQLYGY